MKASSITGPSIISTESQPSVSKRIRRAFVLASSTARRVYDDQLALALL